MSFNFQSTPKSATGFTLPTAAVPGTATTPKFNFSGGGDVNAQSGTEAKQPSLFASSFALSTTVTTSTTSAPTFSLGSALSTPSSTGFALGSSSLSLPQFNLGTGLSTPITTTSASLTFGTSVTSTTLSTGFPLGTSLTTTTAPLNFASSLGALPTSTPVFPLGSLGTGSALTTLTTSGVSALPATGTLTFAQLEDAINKWTSDLEEQGKVFGNQARHLNAWDRLLIANGEKILGVSNGIDRIKQQQQQLDQDLDFVLAQQKELEDCITPLEKELQDVAISDVDRDQTYKLAENIDTQLKQMSEDLKEIIEHLNEANKVQELSDPVSQIGRILNAHMNSLQWIDRNTSQISSHLDEISKMHDLNRRNHETLHGA